MFSLYLMYSRPKIYKDYETNKTTTTTMSPQSCIFVHKPSTSRSLTFLILTLPYLHIHNYYLTTHFLKLIQSTFSAFFPAPILMGMVINSACIYWQYTCGNRGSCWLYDIVAYRNLFIGASVILKCFSVTCFGFLFGYIKPSSRPKAGRKVRQIDERP